MSCVTSMIIFLADELPQRDTTRLACYSLLDTCLHVALVSGGLLDAAITHLSVHAHSAFRVHCKCLLARYCFTYVMLHHSSL